MNNTEPSFYSAMDEIFEVMIENDKGIHSDELIELKSKILLAYQNAINNNANYIGRLIKPKTFKICCDGVITRL